MTRKKRHTAQDRRPYYTDEWHKPNGRRTGSRWANNCEYVVWATNGPRPLDALGSVAFPGFYEANTPRQRDHITQKPVDVLRQLVRIAPEGGTVLDPFAGAGTTAVAAVLEGRHAIGIEINEHFAAVTAHRIREAQSRTARGNAAANLAAPSLPRTGSSR